MNEKVRIARKRLVSADTRHKVAIIAYAEAKASHDGSADAVRECLAARLADLAAEQAANWREMIGTSTPRGLRGVIGIFHAAREENRYHGD